MAYFLFSVALPAVVGFFGVPRTLTALHRAMELIPYEWVQFNKPERISYFLAGALYFGVGADMLHETGGLSTEYLTFTGGGVLGLISYWLRAVPDDNDEDGDESAVTFGDPFNRR